MERTINDQPADKVIEGAVNDAIVRLRKITHNHPSLAAGTPFRKALVKTLRKCLMKLTETSAEAKVTVGDVPYVVTFENFRVVGVQLKAAQQAA